MKAMNSVTRTGGSALYLIPLSSYLGEFVRVDDLDDHRVRANISELREQRIFGTRVSKLSTGRMARAVIPETAGKPGEASKIGEAVSYQAMVFCCDTIEEGMAPSGWMRGFLDGTEENLLPAFFVGGNQCLNFAAGFDVARGLIASGQADSVLVVTSDRILSGTRHPSISMTVFSDGASASLVTCDPQGRSAYELTGTANEKWTPPGPESVGMAEARMTLTAMRSATSRITGGRNSGFRYLVTPNFGSATRKMLAMAAGVATEKLHEGLASTVGHCFSADVPMNMKDLEEANLIAGSDEILAVFASHRSLSVMSFAYRPGSL